MSDRFDLVVYGATGFTGAQAARRLAPIAVREGLRLAVAGRSADKLRALAESLPGQPGVLVADSSRPETVDAMVRQARVMVTTAGPYALYGDPVVDACVAHGVDYVDITGETPWVRRVIDRHHEAARAAGTRIVPLCGFDSIPSDLGVWMMARHAHEVLGQPLRSVHAGFRGKGGFNGGTLASAMTLRESGVMRQLADPLLLNPAEARSAEERARSQDLRGVVWDEELESWVAPFFMAAVNSRVVRRSNALLAAQGQGYGPTFSYQEATPVRSRLKGQTVALGMAAFFGLSGRPAGRALIRRFGPSPGEGPSEETMDSGFFSARFAARTEDGQRFFGKVSCEGDPGNRATVLMLTEAALCLALQRDDLPGGGGVLTPATAFGGVLLDRLRAAGMTWEVPEQR